MSDWLGDGVGEPVPDEAHRELRELLGGYVLGALDDGDRARVEAHLAGCADCRDERDTIVPAAAALADLARSRPPGRPAAVPAGLEERVVATVDGVRRREERVRWTRTVAAAGVAAAVAGVVVVAGLRLTDDATPAAVPLERVPVTERNDAIVASADLVPHTWGVEVQLRARGFTDGKRFRVSVLGADGAEHEAGEFVGTGSRELSCHLSSSVLRAAAVGFDVRSSSGQVVVTSSF